MLLFKRQSALQIAKSRCYARAVSVKLLPYFIFQAKRAQYQNTLSSAAPLPTNKTLLVMDYPLPMTHPNSLTLAEWTALQNQSDRFEQQSLFIKLVAIVVSTTVLLLEANNPLLMAIPGIFWLQDAIWKTFQNRCEQRLVSIEQAIAHSEQVPEFTPVQFNREFIAQRPGLSGLIKEYLSSACRPTVAFPHALLAVLVWL